MPRDLIREADAPTKPDLSKPSLEGLSWLLRHREEWGTHEWRFNDRLCLPKFDPMLSHRLTEGPIAHDCGTLGCALGIGDRRWGYESMKVMEERLGPTMRSQLFLGPYASETYGCPPNEVTPIMVADAIDSYLKARGRV